MRILMVAGMSGLIDLVRAGLDAHDEFEVVGQVAGPEEAVRAIRDFAPDIVAMGDRVDWQEVARRVTEEAPRAAKVLLIDDDELSASKAREALELGFRGVVLKFSELPFIESLAAIGAGHVLIEPKLARELHAPSGVAHDGLSPREREVLQLLVDGLSTKDIAASLFVAHHTARNHIQNVLRKLGTHSRGEAVARAVANGFVPRLEAGMSVAAAVSQPA